MRYDQIAEGLKETRFAGNFQLFDEIKRCLTAYEEAHLFDGGSDFDWRVSHDSDCEDKSCGEHWLVASFYNKGSVVMNKGVEMLKHKAGDTVRIWTKEWMDAQEKDESGCIHFPGANCLLNLAMQEYAGEVVVIEQVFNGWYALAGSRNRWEDWMFDPAYDPSAVIPAKEALFDLVHDLSAILPAKEALFAMLKGETLYGVDGGSGSYSFNEERGCFEWKVDGAVSSSWTFAGFLSREPPKCKWYLTEDEMLAWANSNESLGWMVRCDGIWSFPRDLGYVGAATNYQRARLLPDLSGIDETTIQGFEVEE
jgi:hypothetical protein